jgi:hydrogenase-1 operon protein HyaF
LRSIPIALVPSAGAPAQVGNALPVVHEIFHALRRLLEHGKATVIDLRAIPFGPGDEERLFTLLGRGEVQASLSALGTSHIWETAYPGVWIVDHANDADERVALQVEITRFPNILRSHEDDVRESMVRLEQELRRSRG